MAETDDHVSPPHQADSDINPNAFRMKSGFFRSLRLKLLILCLLLSLIPLSVVSVISYNHARKSVYAQGEKILEAVAELKTEYVKAFFSRMGTDLKVQSESVANTRFLDALTQAFQTADQPLNQFINSPQWRLLVSKKGADLKSFCDTYGYDDLFLIDTRGNVLFSILREDDLGTNLVAGKYSATRFAAACRKTLATGNPVFSDFEFYAPSNDKVAAFFTAPMRDANGGIIGIMALQIPVDQINAFMLHQNGMGRTGKCYLVGADYYMRSDSKFDAESTILKNKVETIGVRDIFSRKPAKAGSGFCRNIVYTDYRGKTVMGHCHYLKAYNMAVVCESDMDEIMAPAKALGRGMLLVLGITGAILIVLTGVFVRRITKPIRQLSKATAAVAEGEFYVDLHIKSGDEIGDLASAFQRMTSKLKKNAEETRSRDWLNTGRIGLNDTLSGEKNLRPLCDAVISYLCTYLDAQVGTLSLMDAGNDRLDIVGTFAYAISDETDRTIALGEGLVGQAALDKTPVIVNEVQEVRLTVLSGLGETVPRAIACVPLIYQNTVEGVVEIGSVHPFGEREMTFLNQAGERIAIAIQTVKRRQRLDKDNLI